MNKRRPVQQAHERAHVGEFLNFLNAARRFPFSVIEEPNPPEAVIQSGRIFRWIEISTIFMNKNWAQDQYSHVTPGERYQPFGNSVIVEPDKQFVTNFIYVLTKKLNKDSYMPFKKKYGPGYLILPINYPLFNRDTVDLMKRRWKEIQPLQNLGCFRGIFLTGRPLRGRFSRWRL